MADLGSVYLMMLGAVAIAVMLFAPQGLWGFVADRFGWQLLRSSGACTLPRSHATNLRPTDTKTNRERDRRPIDKVFITCAVTGAIHTPRV